MRRFKIIVAAIIVVLVIVVVIQNRQRVETRLLVATVTMPRAMLLLLTFLFGFCSGLLVASNIARNPRKRR